MSAIQQIIQELSIHPTVQHFVAWALTHPLVLSFLLSHPVVVRLIRLFFGL